MQHKTDGGPAFPQPIFERTDGAVLTASEYGYGGMSLRDYFAAKAMEACWTNESNRARAREDARNTGNGLYDQIAIEAYDMADAMLRARAAQSPADKE